MIIIACPGPILPRKLSPLIGLEREQTKIVLKYFREHQK